MRDRVSSKSRRDGNADADKRAPARPMPAKKARYLRVKPVPSPSLEPTKQLLAYWRSKCPPGGLPRREDIVPEEIPRLLPNLLIAEPVDGGEDWVYRLIGTAIVERHGKDFTGMRVSESFPPDVADAYIADYQHGAASREPWAVHGNFVFPGIEHIRFEALGLPILGRDGVSVWLLIGLFYFN
jgi:hypothetical protein